MIRYSWLLIGIILLSSCAEVASTMIESDLQHGLQKSQTNHQRRNTDDKALTKKKEQLKNEGKCPTCMGMGKTPEGIICLTCNGTGKYIETSNNKQ